MIKLAYKVMYVPARGVGDTFIVISVVILILFQIPDASWSYERSLVFPDTSYYYLLYKLVNFDYFLGQCGAYV